MDCPRCVTRVARDFANTLDSYDNRFPPTRFGSRSLLSTHDGYEPVRLSAALKVLVGSALHEDENPPPSPYRSPDWSAHYGVATSAVDQPLEIVVSNDESAVQNSSLSFRLWLLFWKHRR